MGNERRQQREHFREAKKRSRRELIKRTARIWTKLYREATQKLKAITGSWLKKILKQAETEISSGYVSDIAEILSKFTQTLEQTLRQALVQGYWLNHVYVQELKNAKQGRKYRGKITLSDDDADAELIEILQAFIRGDMSEEWDVSDEWNEVIPEEAINWLKDYVPKLAGVLSTDVTSKVSSVIRDSMLTGSTLNERMKALRESSDVIQKMTDARIESIARTEITRADSMGRLISMQSNDDVIGVEFSAIMDDRTTEICSSRHGLSMRLDDPRLPENTPPLHVNCVLGDTLVLPIGDISAYSERVFNGDIIVINTAGGNHLSGTPNHPVLTSRGWIPLREIKEGDYVICDTLSKRGNIIDGKNKQVVACIKDTAHTFFDNSKVRATPVPVSAEDFHHDGGQSKVAVIYTDRELPQRRETSGNKQVIKKGFIFRGVISSFLENCKSMFFFSFQRIRFPSFGFMSFLRKFFSVFRSCILHSYKLLFMPVTRFNVVSKQNEFYSTRTNSKTFSNATNTYTLIMQSDDSFMVNGINRTFPLNAAFEQNIIDCIERGFIFFTKFHNADSREIFFDNVVSIEQRRFSGHVYNLQTESGIFVANNIVTHNCRSLLLPCTVYDYPDGLLTSHEFDEVPSGKQRDYDIEEVRTLLGGLKNAVEETVLVPNTRTRAEEIIRQATEYKRQYDELQGQMEAAIARQDYDEYNRLSQIQNEVLKQWRQDVPGDELRNAKIEMAEQGVIYASGISKKLSPNDITEIVQIVEGAPVPVRRVWNLLEGDMKIADTNSRNSYYSSREGAVHVDFLSDKYGSNGRPRYGVLFHELGHLIDNKAIGLGRYVSWTEELHNSLCGEVNSYISSTLVRLRSEALSAGQNPKAIKRSDAYTVVEKEISGQLTMREKIAVSDVFSGVTKNKVNDGWTHSTSYWKENDKNVCLEFFAQTFADSINNPEAIETTKRYFPESYKIFESMITKIGEKKS